MEATYDADRNALDPPEKFVNGLDTLVPDPREGARPGARVPLRTLVRGDLIREVSAVVLEYKPLVVVTRVRNQYATEIEKHEATRTETWLLAQEMSHLIQAKAARHPQLIEWLQPRIGNTPEERAANLANMSGRVVAHKADLAKEKIDLGLWPAHSPDNVEKQVARDDAAAAELSRLYKELAADEKRRVALRTRAEALQPKINSALLNAVGEKETTLLAKLGYQERPHAKSKPRPKVDAQPPAKPGPIAEGTAGKAPAAGAETSTAPAAAPEAKPAAKAEAKPEA